MLNKKIYSKKQVNNISQAGKILSKMVFDNNREHFIVLNLNARNQPISAHTIAIGTLNACVVHPREVLTESIKKKAASFIIAHNHPSGGLEPSDSDIMLIGRLRDAGKLIGIELTDSIIMDRKGNYKSII